MSALLPGQRIEARCTRCKDVTGHIIVHTLEGKVAKVECCACGSVHKYYPPEGAPKERKEKALLVHAGEDRQVKAAKASRAAAPSRSKPADRAEKKTTSRVQQRAQELEQVWESTVATYPGKAVPYSMEGTFQDNILIDHPVFGQGLVRQLLPPNKVEILFREGLKVLRCKC